jgi:hypothetical protein
MKAFTGLEPAKNMNISFRKGQKSAINSVRFKQLITLKR